MDARYVGARGSTGKFCNFVNFFFITGVDNNIKIHILSQIIIDVGLYFLVEVR